MRHRILSLVAAALMAAAQLSAQTADPLAGKSIGVLGDSYVRNHREPVENTWHSKLARKHSMRYFN